MNSCSDATRQRAAAVRKDRKKSAALRMVDKTAVLRQKDGKAAAVRTNS
jgi:hypothetical protein